MIIYRNGTAIELSAFEVRQASEEYHLQCRIEGIKSEIAQNPNLPIIRDISENDLQIIAERTERHLELSSYYDIYWAAVDNAIWDYFQECEEV